MNKIPEILLQIAKVFLGIRLTANADYGCATVREFHTIHPLETANVGKYL